MWSDITIIDWYIQEGSTFLQDKMGDLYNFSKRKGQEFANSPRVQNFAISAIWAYHSVETRFCLFLKGLYDDNRLIRGPVDLFCFLAGIGFRKSQTNHCLTSENWARLCKLVEDEDGFSLISHKIDLDSDECDVDEKIDALVDEIGCSSGVNVFFTMKQGDFYIIRNMEKANRTRATESSVKFINIEYTHSSLEKAIDLTLEKGAYMTGNELFSPVFVLSALQNQSEPYHFDMEYELKFIDSDVNHFSVHSNQYVLIDSENTYLVKESNCAFAH